MSITAAWRDGCIYHQPGGGGVRHSPKLPLPVPAHLATVAHVAQKSNCLSVIIPKDITILSRLVIVVGLLSVIGTQAHASGVSQVFESFPAFVQDLSNDSFLAFTSPDGGYGTHLADSGGTWFMNSRAVLFYDEGLSKWKIYTNSDGLKYNYNIFGLVKNDTFIVAAARNGVNICERAKRAWRPLELPIPNSKPWGDAVDAVEFDKSLLFVGGPGGVFECNPDNGESRFIIRNNGPIAEPISCLHISEDVVWAASVWSLFRFDRKSQTTVRYPIFEFRADSCITGIRITGKTVVLKTTRGVMAYDIKSHRLCMAPINSWPPDDNVDETNISWRYSYHYYERNDEKRRITSRWDFDDRAINHIQGLAYHESTVWASLPDGIWTITGDGSEKIWNGVAGIHKLLFSHGYLWGASESGVFRSNSSLETYELFSPLAQAIFITAFYPLNRDKVLIGTESGLVTISLESGYISHIDTITYLPIDDLVVAADSIWIRSNRALFDISLVSKETHEVDLYALLGESRPPKAPKTTIEGFPFFGDYCGDGVGWQIPYVAKLGLGRSGPFAIVKANINSCFLIAFDTSVNGWRILLLDSSMADAKLTSATESDSFIIFGSNRGLFKIEKATGKVDCFRRSDDKYTFIPDFKDLINDQIDFVFSTNEVVWCGTPRGLSRLTFSSDSWQSMIRSEPFGTGYCNDAMVTESYVYFTSWNESYDGPYEDERWARFDKKSLRWCRYDFKGTSFRTFHASHFVESAGIWFGTRKGLAYVDLNRSKWTQFEIARPLYGIWRLENTVWGISDSSFLKFDISSNKWTEYPFKLIPGKFDIKYGLHFDGHNFLAKCSNGWISFDPQNHIAESHPLGLSQYDFKFRGPHNHYLGAYLQRNYEDIVKGLEIAPTEPWTFHGADPPYFWYSTHGVLLRIYSPESF